MSFTTPVNKYEFTYNVATATGTHNASINIGTRTNGLLIVGFALFDNAPEFFPQVTDVSFGGQALSLATGTSQQNGNTDYHVSIWYLTNPPNGANDLLAHFSHSLNRWYVQASWWDGANQTQAEVLDRAWAGIGTTDPSLDVTPNVDNCLIISQYMSESNDALTVGSGETLLNDNDWGVQVAGSSYAVQTTKQTQTIEWSGPDSFWSMVVAAFKPFVDEGEPGAQFITGTAVVNTNIIGQPTISVGAVNINATGIASTNQFGQPTVTPGTVNISTTGIGHTNVLGEPVISVGEVFISGTGIASSNAFGLPIVSVGEQLISGTGIESTTALGEPTITVGPVFIIPGGIESSNAFGLPTISTGEIFISGTGIGSTATIGEPTITSVVYISGTGISNTNQFGEPTVIQVIQPTGISEENELGQATITVGSVNITATGIASSAVCGLPRVRLETSGNIVAFKRTPFSRFRRI